MSTRLAKRLPLTSGLQFSAGLIYAPQKRSEYRHRSRQLHRPPVSPIFNSAPTSAD